MSDRNAPRPPLPISGMLAAAIYLGILALHLFVRPKFLAIFEELGADLPGLTQVMFQPLVATICLTLAIGMALIAILARNRFLCFVGLAGALLLLGCFVLGLYLPFHTTVTRLP